MYLDGKCDKCIGLNGRENKKKRQTNFLINLCQYLRGTSDKLWSL